MVRLVEREQGPVVGGGRRGGGSVGTEVDVVRRGFGGLFSKPGSTAAGAVLAALVVISSVLVLRSEARSEVLPDLSDGHAWLRSTGVGYLSLVDGASGDVVGSFRVAKAADDFEIQSEGSDAIVVNRSDHTIRRMLARTWEITGPGPFGEVLDTFNCRAFAVCDHQVAHVYVPDPENIPRTREILLRQPGICAPETATMKWTSSSSETTTRLWRSK